MPPIKKNGQNNEAVNSNSAPPPTIDDINDAFVASNRDAMDDVEEFNEEVNNGDDEREEFLNEPREFLNQPNEKDELRTKLSALLKKDENGFLDLIASVVHGDGNKAKAKKNSTPSSDYVTRAEMEDLMDAKLNEKKKPSQTKLPQEKAIEVMSPFGDLDPAEEQRGLLKKDDDGQEMHIPFGESAYTMFFLHELRSQAFWYACLVYALQISSISLTLIDVIDKDRKNNPLGIPPMVGAPVTAAQAFALFLLAAYASDLIEAVLKIQDGYYPEVLPRFPGATFSSWAFSCGAQLAAGLLLLVASFVLTMMVDNVIDVMLNLTALLFMSEIDDLGFSMAKLGFITDQLQREAYEVLDVEVPKRERRNIWRRLLYLLALGGLFAGYGVLKSRQFEGYYLSNYVYAQFGDGSSKNFEIPYFSGILTANDMRTGGRREYRDLGTANILLAYCDELAAWTFTLTDRPCDDYFARSPETETYDVTTIPMTEWEVVNSINRLEPFDVFSLVSIDCDPKICQGKCEKGLCVCPPDAFGLDCGFRNVCPEMSVDRRTSPFPVRTFNQSVDDDVRFSNMATFPISNQFHILRNESTGEYARAYNMPVFYSNKTYPANIILFGGLRWILTSELDLINLTEAELQYPGRKFFPEKTMEVLNSGFHAYYRARYTAFFLSEKMDFSTPEFSATPVDLRWWSVAVMNATERHYVPFTPLETRLICEGCSLDQEDACGLSGVCNPVTRECDCAPGYKGFRCEQLEECFEMTYPCSGHGSCEETSGQCECAEPYYGKLCQFQYQCFEEQGSCKNNGTCSVDSGSCECSEDPAISGAACEVRQDCHVSGCDNGGLCGPTGSCACRPPYYGTLCQLVNYTADYNLFCAVEFDCINGDCSDETGLCACSNYSTFGSLCQYSYDCTASDLYVCANNSTCNRETGLCDCLEPFFGPDCSRAPLCVVDDQCTGDGYCDIRTGTCQSRRTCERHGCNGRGTCNFNTGNCQCDYPFTGILCESRFSLEEDEALLEQFKLQVEECGFPPYSPGSEAAELGCPRNMTSRYWERYTLDRI